MPTTTTSTRKGHFQTPSFSSISNFSSTFGSSPPSPEDRLLPLSTQDSPPLSPASPTRPKLPLLRSVPSVRLSLVLRALGAKIKILMRGNGPLLIVFFSCLLIFLGALSGTGYHDPDELALSSSSSLLGSNGMQLDGSFLPIEIEAERGLSQRELEELWRGMGRGKKDGAWLKEARDKRETRRIAPIPVAVKNPPRKLVSHDEEDEEEEEEEDEEEAQVAKVENEIKENVRVVREEDRRPRVVDIFDFTGHEFGSHEGGSADGETPQKVEQAGKPKPKAALDEIVGGQTKEDI